MLTTLQFISNIHAFFSGFGLFIAFLHLLIKKESKIYTKINRLFLLIVFIISVLSLLVAKIPLQENNLLFLFGSTSIIMILFTNRVQLFHIKKKTNLTKIDSLVSESILTISIIVIVLGLIGPHQEQGLNILWTIWNISLI
jgi:hypothetical protein